MTRWRGTRRVAASAASLVLCACSTDGGPTVAGLPELPKLADLPSLPPLSGAGRVVGTPIELYTRIARGVLTCWFGASGPLKTEYIYHAEADPPSKGGRSEIVIHRRDTSVASDPRANRAFRVSIEPSPETTTKLEVENVSLPEPLAGRLKADVARWAAAEDETCAEAPAGTAWSAETTDKGAATAKQAKKAEKKP